MEDSSSIEPAPSYTPETSGSTSHDQMQDSCLPIGPAQSLQLLYVNRKSQTVSFPPETASFHYNVHVNDSSGLIRKPDLIISREDGGLVEKVGEGRFEKYGPGTTIKYPESGAIHDLQLESSISQRFMITLDGKALWWWQTSRRDNRVAEVVTSGNEIIAQFTYSGIHTLVGRDVKDDTVLGVLEVGDQYASQPAVLDQLVSMTVVLVERGRRRGRNLRGVEGTNALAGMVSDGIMY